MDLNTYAQLLIEGGPAYALVGECGTVWGCAGVQELEKHRAMAWALIHDEIGTRFMKFHKSVLAFLEGTEYPRIEMAVGCDFKKASRWAHMLGFQHEGFMRQYFPDRSHALLYARVK